MIEFKVSGRPKAWERARSKGKMRFNSAKMTVAEEIFALSCQQNMRGKGQNPYPQGTALKMELYFRFALPKRGKKTEGEPYMSTPDLDNLVKLIGDALNGVAYEDDRQIIHCQSLKVYGAASETIVRITPYDG